MTACLPTEPSQEADASRLDVGRADVPLEAPAVGDATGLKGDAMGVKVDASTWDGPAPTPADFRSSPPDGSADGSAPDPDGAPADDALPLEAGSPDLQVPADARPAVDARPDVGPDVARPNHDGDGDGVPDEFDLCPAAADPRQSDADGDGLGDACDRGDADLDGLPDTEDPCPSLALPTADGDGDGIGDLCDLCPADGDPRQLDGDGDGIGDACEIPNDDDADGSPDWSDTCPHLADPRQLDDDADGVGDACDVCPSAPDPEQGDADGDGVGDACDPCPRVPVGDPTDVDADADGVRVCAGDCDDGQAARAPTLPERCNGVDDNCDGRVDEVFFGLGDPCARDIGACRRVGVFRCGADGLATCDAELASPTPEVCDGIDNDCDATADEELIGCCPPGVTEACGIEVGPCARGERTCGADGTWTPCSGAMPAPEACDGTDDDCDGQIDNDLGDRICGQGVCAHPIALCVRGAPVECDPLTGARPEVCNGLDDDCDGEADEGVANACGGCGAEPPEACNGLDDDCDGDVDEGVLNACGACGPTPAEVCNGRDEDCDGDVDDGVLNACGGCGAPSPEVCNFRDDDCDGEVDEGVRNACGACGAVSAEVCNGADDDCDGQVDEGVQNACRACGVVPAERCNGQDDDCDGQVDEGDFGACLTGEPGLCGPGRAQCQNGLLRCVRAQEPRAEACNSLDDDCDGEVDDVPPAQLRVYNRDADNDGFGDPAVTIEACQAPAGYVNNSGDCYDHSRSAFPGQQGYFDGHRGDGSYDYDCDGRETRHWTTLMAYSCQLVACAYREGWDRVVPPCGATEEWLSSCSGAANVCFSFDLDVRRQACR